MAVVLLLCLASGCAAGPEAEAPTERFFVTVENGTSERIMGLHMEYMLFGEATGGGIVENANGSALDLKQRLSWEFLPRDFPDNSDLSGFSIAYFVVLPDGEEVACGEPLAFPAAYGEEYCYVLSGNMSDGFALGIQQTR